MTNEQKKKCHAIIHGHAVAAAAGNVVPVPGLGVATDMVAMVTMTMSLCAVFGGNISKRAAETLAIAALKNTLLKQPIKTLTRELSKLIPGLGQIVAPSITVVMLEAAGWVLANELQQKLASPKQEGKRSAHRSAKRTRRSTRKATNDALLRTGGAHRAAAGAARARRRAKR